MSELTVLQAVRLKGRVSEADLLATLGECEADVAAIVAQLTAAGMLMEGKPVRITPEGRERLNTLLTHERSGVDQTALAQTYGEFRTVNGEFKAVVAAWQLKDGQPNMHDDADYDAAIFDRLDIVHRRVSPILGAVASLLPRLGGYGDKLDSALAKVKAGDTTWFTRPIIDSYHTVWFELHEELIAASGLTREDEARAGHAD
ncbi:MarR family transcriptional regulator [Mycobacterium sp. CVI_P3]|uniref:MarR family transcriptional regulator n=1 Tax=Mycobacterium pinniadriaticum TaxID=2994102 RepID=A0ABT3SAJ6_9MYCO|nr:MarR family transcriptional regulator [Mycobacterium pinniadriaticum]MCX2929949.1 MarR family transcriptional regulator [Mycobacterium pinniadriaticum]MCX2936402.1 MarR family transcriptional regulator [Mycobacterium pinniadriaticum]